MMKGYLFACLLATALALIVLAPQGEAATYYVDDDDTTGQWSDYTDIQDAIDAASADDVIYVYNGTYYENVVVDVAVDLIGNGTDDTVIDGGDNGDVVHVSSNGVMVTGFTVQNAFAGQDGIDIDADDVIIDNCTIMDCAFRGVYSLNRNNLVLNSLNVTIGGGGITLTYVNESSVQWSEINDCTPGISVSDPEEIAFRNITFWGCSFDWSGTTASDFNTNGVYDCNINGNPIVLYTDLDNGTVTGDHGQVIMGACYDMVIWDVALSDGSNGIQMGACERILIHNVTITDTDNAINIRHTEDLAIRDSELIDFNVRGIQLIYCTYVDIINVTLSTTTNGYGLYIFAGNIGVNVTDSYFASARRGINNRANGAIFTNNSFDTGWNGIWMSSTDDCTITNNVFTSDTSGVYMSASDGNLIANNTFKNCGQEGVTLSGIENNTIIYNEIFGCTNEGIKIDGSSWNNDFHHNNFYDNGGGSSQAKDDSTGTNTWDDGVTEGNYWDDWGGTGTYDINGAAGAEDRYPLENPVNNSAPEKVPEFAPMVAMMALAMLSLVLMRRRRH